MFKLGYQVQQHLTMLPLTLMIEYNVYHDISHDTHTPCSILTLLPSSYIATRHTIHYKTFKGESFMFRLKNSYLLENFHGSHACTFILPINIPIIIHRRLAIE